MEFFNEIWLKVGKHECIDIRAQNTRGLRVICPQIVQNSPFEKYLLMAKYTQGGYFWLNLSKIAPITKKVF